MPKIFLNFIILLIWFLTFILILLMSIKLFHMHPIKFIIMIIGYNFLMTLNMSLWKSNFMYSIMIFLILISGLLIIFMYFSSLISNEKMFYSNFNINFIMIPMLIMIMFILLNYYLIPLTSFSYKFNETSLYTYMNTNNFINILFMHTYPFNNFTLMTIMFLLAAFFTIIKINTSSHFSSMRKIKK